MQSARIINFLIFLESVKNIFCIVTKFLAACNCCIKIMKFIYSVSLLTRSHHGFLVFSKPLQGTTVTVCVDKLKCLLQILKKKSIPCLWLMLPLKAMQMFTVCADPEVILMALLPLRAVSGSNVLLQLGLYWYMWMSHDLLKQYWSQ